MFSRMRSDVMSILDNNDCEHITADEVRACNDLYGTPSLVKYNGDLVIVEDCESDAQDKREVTLESAKFAAVTRTAHAMVPLITQEFEVRFKGSDEAFRHLKYAGMRHSASQLVGKTFKVTVDWSSVRNALWLYFEGRLFVCILPSEFNEVFTQKGKIIGMCEFWKDASGYNSRNK